MESIVFNHPIWWSRTKDREVLSIPHLWGGFYQIKSNCWGVQAPNVPTLWALLHWHFSHEVSYVRIHPSRYCVGSHHHRAEGWTWNWVKFGTMRGSMFFLKTGFLGRMVLLIFNVYSLPLVCFVGASGVNCVANIQCDCVLWRVQLLLLFCFCSDALRLIIEYRMSFV